MKKCETFMARLSSGSDRMRGGSIQNRGDHLRARPYGSESPSMITRSEGSSPERMDPEAVAKVARLWTRFGVTTSFRADDQDDVLRRSGRTGRVRHEQGGRPRSDPRERDTRAKPPAGVSSRSLFGYCGAGMGWCRSSGSEPCLSTKSSVPSWGEGPSSSGQGRSATLSAEAAPFCC